MLPLLSISLSGGGKVSKEIEQVWKECGLEIDANHKVGEKVQELVQLSILNASAMKSLNDASAEELVKNS